MTSLSERITNLLAQETPPAAEWELREMLRQAAAYLSELELEGIV